MRRRQDWDDADRGSTPDARDFVDGIGRLALAWTRVGVDAASASTRMATDMVAEGATRVLEDLTGARRSWPRGERPPSAKDLDGQETEEDKRNRRPHWTDLAGGAVFGLRRMADLLTQTADIFADTFARRAGRKSDAAGKRE